MNKNPVIEPLNDKLKKDELERLDSLLATARWFHYSAFVLSGFSLALSSLETIDTIKLPIGDIEIPALQATVGVYILVLILTLASLRLFNMALPWLKLDIRRPQFAWIALSTKEPTGLSVVFWLLIPVIICAVATAISLSQNDLTGYLLSFIGIIVILSPNTIDEDSYLIRKKLDHRGGESTYSIWLLYWYRLVRSLIFIIVFFLPVIAVVPKWRINILNIEPKLMLMFGVMYILRLIAGIPVIYRLIDRIGFKLGFPKESKNYK